MIRRIRVWFLKRAMVRHTDAAKHAGRHRNAAAHRFHYEKMREIYRELRRLDPRCPEWKALRAEPTELKRKRRKNGSPL